MGASVQHNRETIRKPSNSRRQILEKKSWYLSSTQTPSRLISPCFVGQVPPCHPVAPTHGFPRSECQARPSTDKTSQMSPAWLTMFNRTSWNSSCDGAPPGAPLGSVCWLQHGTCEAWLHVKHAVNSNAWQRHHVCGEAVECLGMTFLD